MIGRINSNRIKTVKIETIDNGYSLYVNNLPPIQVTGKHNILNIIDSKLANIVLVSYDKSVFQVDLASAKVDEYIHTDMIINDFFSYNAIYIIRTEIAILFVNDDKVITRVESFNEVILDVIVFESKLYIFLLSGELRIIDPKTSEGA